MPKLQTRLQDRLQKFLIQYDISVDTEIFNDVVLHQLLGIPGDRGKGGFETLKYGGNDKEFIPLTLPSVTVEEYRQILAFLEIPVESAMIGEDLIISEDLLFRKIVPLFESHVKSNMKQDSSQFDRYKIDSKPILESMTIKQIEKATTKLLAELNQINAIETLSHRVKSLSRILFGIRGALSGIEKEPQQYVYLLASVAKLDKFFVSHPNMRQQEGLKLTIDLIYDGLHNYSKYTRAKSAIAAVKFHSDLTAYLLSHGLTAKDSNILEETLLKMAGVSTMPLKSQFKTGYDRTRIVFSFKDMTKANADKFINYFKSHGDITATEGDGYGSGSRYVPESAAMSTQEESVEGGPGRKAKEVEHHSIEVDALVLYETILPKFKAQIDTWAKESPELLKPYRAEQAQSSQVNPFAFHRPGKKDEMNESGMALRV
jgi:hypothetical protein